MLPREVRTPQNLSVKCVGAKLSALEDFFNPG